MKSVLLVLTGALVAAIALFSQTITPQPDDPPVRVGRLNWLSGDVSFQPAGLEEWTAATINYPLTTSDHLFTGKDGRAELHVGPNAIRLDANTNFGFLNLDDSMVQLSLTEGSIEIQLTALDDDDPFEVATPSGAVTLLRVGDYRIDTDPERDATMLTVRAGQAELFSGANSVVIRARQTAYFRADQNPDVRTANNPDDFDSFVAEREDKVVTADPVVAAAAGPTRGGDRFSDRMAPLNGPAAVAELESEGVTGAEDLNAYGTWQNTMPYGEAWVPPVDPGWTPYSDGDWAFVEPWGWTWVDNAPWGFTVFHYGRWALVNSRWMWVPGARGTNTVYAPALVTFVGGGAASNVSWFPLSPREDWSPPWRNAVEPVALPRLSNRNVPGAVHTLSQSDFVSGGRVKPMSALVAEGQVLGTLAPVMPVRDSVLMGPPRTRPLVVNRPLIARTAPPPAPITFAAKLGMLAQNQGRPLTPRQLGDLRHQLPAAVTTRAAVRSTVPLVSTPRVAKPAAPAKADKGTRPGPGR